MPGKGFKHVLRVMTYVSASTELELARSMSKDNSIRHRMADVFFDSDWFFLHDIEVMGDDVIVHQRAINVSLRKRHDHGLDVVKNCVKKIVVNG